MAAKADFDEVVFDERVRKFIFDEAAPIPDDICVYYWLYPYSQVIIMRDFVMPARRGDFGEVGLFQTLKYFPIAYLVTDRQQYERLFELTQYRNLGTYDEVDLLLQVGRTEHPHWPEIVDAGNFLFGGGSGRCPVLPLK